LIVIEAMTLDSGATAALLGAGGWLLAETTQSLRAWWRNRTARETAAKLIYAELGHNLAALSALREYGEWILASTSRRAAWKAHGGAALVRGRRIEEVGTISMGYSAVDDVALVVADGQSDFTRGDALIRNYILLAYRRAGIMKKVMPLHSLRHTRLTYEAAAGNPQAYIQLKAGHSDGRMTER
jgi:integrase